MIPMVDLKGQYLAIKEEIDRGILEALEKTQFILGPNVTAFEEEAAAFLGTRYAVGVASGTDALHLALAAAGITAGDEVITTPFTFIATAEAIRYVGATPVFVDIDPRTFNIDPALIEAAITPKTRAVLPVHLFGQPADMAAIEAICSKHGLLLIEDCAQSFGAEAAGRMTGSRGALGAFSFFPSKNLGCYGDGGLVTTSSPELAEQVKVLRNHGSKVRYHHSVIGFNSRLDEVQAVILRVKLKRLREYNEGRRRVAHLYSSLLAGSGVVTPFEDGKGVHVYHQYTLLSDHREAIMKALGEAGIASAVYYPIPLHRQDVFAADYAGVTLPVAEEVAARCMSLPIFPEMTAAQVEEVVAVIKRVVAA
ncbi:UDP-2-acetamido-2-deoxy-alpha-D-ribo-hexopyranos- 3-ulose 3-aminotransferase [Geotalea uraniireducens]|uniref:UDP-2-acetamido-2-deoxy-alpha-D-ribo-hexopyranos- 3-ulose 3-aminotransferase n=1 Tax=Geotalea uraniireducens TaxID=351604 RepID=A0ABN6VWD9_9BACT|nr:DegT/DnrJ/EryC1/StrS family aminotransferase [Geotalea uraniireducens]BDV42540.1 UDP-2-acetamido-2-deoxy-alpha-D-ribo-hexopyranos- 3-ulose 3-aminotransferase [Geotalea uraniireducens]